ncbi:unnamed protein product [Effrenium voratum]|nr:unnamed protein product [Effrenium voratum]CAJ1461923.1 unnamed protein product [Effrenium voratum]
MRCGHPWEVAPGAKACEWRGSGYDVLLQGDAHAQIWRLAPFRKQSSTNFLWGAESQDPWLNMTSSSTTCTKAHSSRGGVRTALDETKEVEEAAKDEEELDEAKDEAPKEQDEINPECSKTRKTEVARCCLCMNGEAIWSQDGSCQHCKDNGGIKDCSEVDVNCKPGSISWPLKYKEQHKEGEEKEKDWNEEDDSRGEICAETCAEKWISKINGEMNIPRARPPQLAGKLTKEAEKEAANQAEATKEEAELEHEMDKHADELGA